jgi:hypothetical protein
MLEVHHRQAPCRRLHALHCSASVRSSRCRIPAATRFNHLCRHFPGPTTPWPTTITTWSVHNIASLMYPWQILGEARSPTTADCNNCQPLPKFLSSHHSLSVCILCWVDYNMTIMIIHTTYYKLELSIESSLKHCPSGVQNL